MVLPAIAGAAGMITSFLGSGASSDEERALRLQRQAAMGTQPSQAELLAKSAGNRAVRNMMSMAAARPGTNPNLAARNAMVQGGQMQAQVAAQAGAMRAQEMAQARAAYAGQAQQVGNVNRQKWAALGAGLGALGGGLTAFSGPGGAAGGNPAAGQGMMTMNPGGSYQIPGGDATDRIMSRMPPVFNSDERVKREIRDATGMEMDQFLSALRGREFTYNGPQAGPPGRQVGPMAQDLERTSVGQNIVQRGPDGIRQINAQRALQANMAGMGRLDERVRELEDQNATLRALAERQGGRLEANTATAEARARAANRPRVQIGPATIESRNIDGTNVPANVTREMLEANRRRVPGPKRYKPQVMTPPLLSPPQRLPAPVEAMSPGPLLMRRLTRGF